MPDFDEVQFPTDISEGSLGGPEFSTEIVELGNRHENRNQNWSQARERWNVAYGVKHLDHLRALVSFFYQRRGPARGFRFRSHDDYQATEQQELVQLTGTTHQLVLRYGAGTSYEYIRTIYKPVVGTVQVFVNNILRTTNLSIDHTTGIVTFAAPIPSTGDLVEATFDFDIPARFGEDTLPVNFETYRARSANVPVIEIPI